MVHVIDLPNIIGETKETPLAGSFGKNGKGSVHEESLYRSTHWTKTWQEIAQDQEKWRNHI